MQKVKCIYDLSQEAEYSIEDAEVFGLIWNRHSGDTLADKIIVQTADGLLLTKKPTANRLRWMRALPFLLAASATVLVFTIFISAFMILTDPSRYTFWGLVISLFGLGSVIGLIDLIFGGK